MVNQQQGTSDYGRLPPYPVRRRSSDMLESGSCLLEPTRQLSVADLYPDGYSS
jgi:hypothetical protein